MKINDFKSYQILLFVIFKKKEKKKKNQFQIFKLYYLYFVVGKSNDLSKSSGGAGACTWHFTLPTLHGVFLCECHVTILYF